MLCFLPPGPGVPRPGRRDRPEPAGSGRSSVGITVAVVLTLAGMLLPWLRPDAHRIGDPHPRGGASAGDAVASDGGR